ncbi:restriction endonuclease [Herbidospora sp. RD11066]
MDKTTSNEDRALHPKTFVELAMDHQRDYAAYYVATHRRKRTISWILAIIFASYALSMVIHLPPSETSPAWIQVAIFAVATVLLPLSLAANAAEKAKEWTANFTLWLAAWTFPTINTASLLIDTPTGPASLHQISGVLASISMIAVLAIGLRIPESPFLDWDTVFEDYISNVGTATGGASAEAILADYRDAEFMAAAWLRRFGYRDAKAVPPGPDGGVDAYANRAIAQVKFWRDKRVGIGDVQRLSGTAKPGQAAYFFAAFGYTKKAEEWARDPETNVALFLIRSDGSLVAKNYLARRAIWKSRTMLPSAFREPGSLRSKIVISVVSLVGLIFFTSLLAYLTITQASFGALLFAIVMLLIYIYLFFATLHRDIARLRSAISRSRTGEGWPKWREIIQVDFTEYPDANLPPDQFYGYDDAKLRVFCILADTVLIFRRTSSVLRRRIRP